MYTTKCNYINISHRSIRRKTNKHAHNSRKVGKIYELTTHNKEIKVVNKYKKKTSLVIIKINI